jgi:hypothetical protein
MKVGILADLFYYLSMKLLDTKTLNSLQKEAVRKLWNEEYPKSIGLKHLKI